MEPLLIVCAVILLLVVAVILIEKKSRVQIDNRHVGIIYKKHTFNPFSRNQHLPAGRKIALNGEIGFQANVLNEGLHRFYWHWMYDIKQVPMVKIEHGEIALVVARDGESIPSGRQLAKHVDCDNFQNAQAFLVNCGQMGPQIDVLPAGEYQINTELFTVITVNNATEHNMSSNDLHVYYVGADKVGIVTTYDGASLTQDEIAGRIIEGHANFQNGQIFIDGGGFRGLQEEILLVGAYNLNPWFVQIEQVPLTNILPGTVGVVISNIGKIPEDGNAAKLVERGYKGFWRIPLYPGKHPINTKVRSVEIVPTHEIILDWSDKDKKSWNYDASLHKLKLRSKDGFEFGIEVTQVININGEDAPKMLARVGSPAPGTPGSEVGQDPNLVRFRSIRNLVDRVLGPMVDNYFRNAGQDYEALDFLERRGERQREGEAFIKTALREHGVEAVGTFINEIDLPDELEKLRIDRKIAEEALVTYKAQQLAEQERQKLIEETRKAEKQTELVDHHIRMTIARNEAEARVEIANKEAEALRQIAEAKTEEFRQMKMAEMEALGEQIKHEGGSDAHARNLLIKALPEIPIPNTPSIVMGGNSEPTANLTSVLIAKMLQSGIARPQLTDQSNFMQLLEVIALQNDERGKLAYMRLRNLASDPQADGKEVLALLRQFGFGTQDPDKQISLNPDSSEMTE